MEQRTLYPELGMTVTVAGPGIVTIERILQAGEHPAEALSELTLALSICAGNVLDAAAATAATPDRATTRAFRLTLEAIKGEEV